MPARKTYATLVLIAFIYLVGANLQTGWVYLLTAFIVSLIAVSYVVGKAAIRKVQIDRVMPGRATAGRPIKVKYSVRKAPPHFRVEDTGIELTASGTTESLSIEKEKALQRGIYELSELKVKSSYPGGWFTFAASLSQPHTLVVWPEVDAVQLGVASGGGSGMMAAPSRADRGLEYAGVREFKPGDSIRRIHWKRTARSGEVFVRETVSNSSQLFVVFADNRCTEDYDAELFEHQVAVAASVVDWLWRNSLRQKLVFFDDGRLKTIEGTYEQLMDVLAGIKPEFSNGRANGTADEVFEQSAEGAVLVYIVPQAASEHELLSGFRDVLAVCVGNTKGCAGTRNIFVAVEQGTRRWLL